MAEAVTYVLDAFALLAYLQGEQMGARVRGILQSAQSDHRKIYMSLINVGEVLYITERKQGLRKAQAALASIYQLPVELLPVDEQIIFAAAHIKANYPVSYADSFVIATAQTLSCTVVTGDPEFESVAALVTVEWLKE
jgi:predicted nucleic acid-binding protein